MDEHGLLQEGPVNADNDFTEDIGLSSELLIAREKWEKVDQMISVEILSVDYLTWQWLLPWMQFEKSSRLLFFLLLALALTWIWNFWLFFHQEYWKVEKNLPAWTAIGANSLEMLDATRYSLGEILINRLRLFSLAFGRGIGKLEIFVKNRFRSKGFAPWIRN